MREYLVDRNATQAAIRAKYSPKTAHSQGPRLLENVEVAKAVAAGTAKLAEKLELTADGVLRDLVRLADAAETAKEFGPAIKARALLGKHLGLFPNKHELAGTGGEALTVVVQTLADAKGKK